MYFKSVLAVAISATLIGCGGSGGETQTTTASGPKAQIIDGYLVNAEVYVDRNDNGVADADEKLAGLTDNQGYIAIAEADKNHRLIARAVAGKTFDTDKGGAITKSYELASPAGNTTVTPYTTIAVIENKTIDVVAAELNLSKELIAGDYVAAKSDVSQTDAKKVHLIARSLTLELKDNIAESKTSKANIQTQLGKIQTGVDTAINQSKDLDSIVIVDGAEAPAPKTPKELLVGNTYFTIPTNEGYFKHEGVGQFTFAADKITWAASQHENAGESPITYTDMGYNAGDGEDKLLFAADKFYLSVPSQNDIILNVLNDSYDGNAKSFTKRAVAATNFNGKTLFHFWDDAPDTNPRPHLSKFVFGSDGKVVISEKNSTSDWRVHDAVNWSITDGELVMDVPEEVGKTFTWTFTDLEQDGLEIAHDARGIPLFFTENEDLANSLFEKWLSISK